MFLFQQNKGTHHKKILSKVREVGAWGKEILGKTVLLWNKININAKVAVLQYV